MTPGGAVAGSQTNRVYITGKRIILQAVSTNPADTLIVGGGSIGPDAVRCVYIIASGSEGSAVRGFTLTNGHAGTTAFYQGGGGLNTERAIVVSNCIITGCFSPTYGGGMYARYAGVTQYNCVVSGNCASNGGGVCSFSGLVITNSLITGNLASNGGGGLSVCTVYSSTIANNTAGGRGGAGESVNAYDCYISNNVAATFGGGIYGDGSVVSHCVVSSNRANGNNGGGVWGVTVKNNSLIASNYAGGRGGGAADAYVYDSTVVGNTAASYGGGLASGADLARAVSKNSLFIDNTGNWGGGQFRGSATNCLLAQNHAVTYAGAAYGPAILVNCTVVSNTVQTAGGGGSFYTAVIATNCIVWGNLQLSDGATNNWVPSQSGYSFAYTCIFPLPAGATNVAGNIDADPRFVNFTGGNYRLGSGSSPCVNAGTNQEWMTISYDLDGKIRIRYGFVDMGCYEYIYSGTIFSVR